MTGQKEASNIPRISGTMMPLAHMRRGAQVKIDGNTARPSILQTSHTSASINNTSTTCVIDSQRDHNFMRNFTELQME
jgi:hypothetical protein